MGKIYTDDQLRELERYLSFDSMKAKEDRGFLCQFMKNYAKAEGDVAENINENIA